MATNIEKHHNYKKLKIWGIAIEIADEVYQALDSFPSKEKFGLCSQISRSSVSLSSNIAEGSSRSNKSFAHYLDIALGSSYELETQLIISNNRSYIELDHYEILQEKLSQFQKMSRMFRNRLNKSSV